MMNFIKGNIRTIIFESDNGFFVGTFKIKETNDEALQEKINKVITVTGLLLEPNCDDTYELSGKYIRNERYGYQFTFDSYEKLKPEGKDAVVEFLASNLIKGCGFWLKGASQENNWSLYSASKFGSPWSSAST